jgi:hypothetical protein
MTDTLRDFDALEGLHIADPEVLGPDCYGCPPGTPWPCEVVALLKVARQMRVALQRADSRLSLLRHRGQIPWGGLSIGTAEECDEIIGQARGALEDSSGLAPERERREFGRRESAH